jgi:hypothetical protein
MKKGYKGLTVSGSQVFSLCKIDEVCSFNIETGEKLWSYKLSEEQDIVFDFMVEYSVSEPGYLFFGSDEKLFALSVADGKSVWESEELPELRTYAPIGDTILVNYEVIDGLDINTGESKWITPYSGERIRCVMDGQLVAQSESHFNFLWIENGKEIGNYPREGITMLNCQNQLSLAAFTVKKNPDNENRAEYFDRIDIYNTGSGKRVFDYRADEGKTLLNIAEMLNDFFYIVVADDQTDRKAEVHRYSYSNWEKDAVYSIPDPESGKNLYITLTYIDAKHSIFKSTIYDLSDNIPVKNHLYDTETGEMIGELVKHPEIITPNHAYDIVIYDEYFNIIQKKLSDFLK